MPPPPPSPSPAPDGRGRSTIRLDQRPGGSPGVPGRGVSGRVFVVGVVLGVLAAWGGLFLAFDWWRAGARERIAFGKRSVPPVVRPLATLDPPGIAADDWRAAVAESEAMLEEIVGTGRLDRPTLEALRSDLSGRVAEARDDPRSAPAILGAIWDDMARLKRFRDRTGRPGVLPPPESGRPGR